MAEGGQGYCKICAHPDAAPRMIVAARDGLSSAKALEIARVYGLEFNRKTWYAHVEHAMTGTGRMMQAADKVREQGLLTMDQVKKTSNTGLLEALRDIGMAKAVLHPENVSIDHALKAVQIMEAKKDRGGDQLNILLQFVTGHAPAVIVEGVTRDVPD